MNKETEYIQIDLLKIAEGILRRIWLVILSMILCGGLLFSYAAFYITPQYESSVLMYVNNSSISVGASKLSITASEISAAKSLVETYLVILKTRTTLNDVIRLGGLDRTYEELRSMITAEPVNETEIFSVTITSPDPFEAEHIANTIARVVPEKIASVVDGSSVRIVDYAVVPSGKVSPSVKKYTLVGLLMGLMASCGFIAVMEISDDRIRSENYLLENFSDIPLLSVIPDMMEEKSKDQYYYSYTQQSSRKPKKQTTVDKTTAGGGKA